MNRWLVVGVGLLSLTACAKRSDARAQSGVNNVSAPRPAVSSVSPASGPAGTAYPIELTIAGTSFADTGNAVTFGPVTVKSLKSTNGGTRIVMFVPKAMPSTGEVPPMPLLPGEYPVRVATASGTSNAVTFTLTREP